MLKDLNILFYLNNLKKYANNMFITLWLSGWFATNMWLVLGSLTSYQLQQTISTDLTKYTVSGVVRLLNELNKTENLIYQLETEIATRNHELNQLYAAGHASEQTYTNTWHQFLALKSYPFVHQKDAMISMIHGFPTQIGYLDCYALMPEDAENKDASSEERHFYEICQKANKYWYVLQDKKTLIPFKKIALHKLEATLHEKKQALAFLLESNQEAKDYITQLSYMRKFLFDRLATMPIQLLTLILTLSMGSLGSLIFLTQNMFNNKQHLKLIDFLFHPFLGMVMAIAIFILAKSGQMVAVSSESQGEGINLNPFFISFLAIISGVLSKQAYDKIYQTGKSFFEQGESQPRWAVNIENIMQEQGKAAQDIKPYINQKIEIIEDWLTGKKAVPEEYQTLISLWLHTEQRKIFTDIP